MEHRICPILGSGPVEINSNCKEERCALWNEPAARCSIAIIAEDMRSASADHSAIAESLPEISNELHNITNALKGTV